MQYSGRYEVNTTRKNREPGMIGLLAESGATKTEWRLYNSIGILKSFTTRGLNPTSTEEEVLQKEIKEIYQHILTEYAVEPTEIFFYGAGLDHQDQRQKLTSVLSRNFSTDHISVYTDLLAAVRCTGKQRGIVCILGTGSNSCYYDGDQILQHYGGWGYLLGDEGSGADLGKELLKMLMHKQLPEDIETAILGRLDRPLKAFTVYAQQCERPSLTLASLTPIVYDYLYVREIRDMVEDRFRLMLFTTIMKFNVIEDIEVDFVGSVSHYFRDVLLDQCRDLAINVDKIIKDPIENLLNFHQISRV